MTAILPVGSDTVTVNGKKLEGACSRIDADGQIRVTLKTLGHILSLKWLLQNY